MFHEVLRWLAEGEHLEPSRSPRLTPCHDDTAGLQLTIPLNHHVPDTLAHALAHSRARVDAGSQFQHHRAEEATESHLNITADDDTEGRAIPLFTGGGGSDASSDGASDVVSAANSGGPISALM